MFDDDLERRATEPVVNVTGAGERSLEVMAVGLFWALGGTVLGLLAAVLISVWLDSTTALGGLGILGALVGAMVGLLLEVTDFGS